MAKSFQIDRKTLLLGDIFPTAAGWEKRRENRCQVNGSQQCELNWAGLTGWCPLYQKFFAPQALLSFFLTHSHWEADNAFSLMAADRNRILATFTKNLVSSQIYKDFRSVSIYSLLKKWNQLKNYPRNFCKNIQKSRTTLWFDSMIRLYDSILWFESMIRLNDSTLWLDSLIRFYQSNLWFDSMILLYCLTLWFESMLWLYDSTLWFDFMIRLYDATQRFVSLIGFNDLILWLRILLIIAVYKI